MRVCDARIAHTSVHRLVTTLLIRMRRRRGRLPSGATSHYWWRYLHNGSQSEWAARARRSLKFCKMQVHLLCLVTQLIGSSVVFSVVISDSTKFGLLCRERQTGS